MESLALLPVTIASILGPFSGGGLPAEEAVIRTHISPEIAGLWELQLETKEGSFFNIDTRSNDILIDITPEQSSQLDSDSVITILEKSSLQQPSATQTANTKAEKPQAQEANTQAINAAPSTSTSTQACRERYNFGADNLLLTTSGEEWTYGNYVYQHQESGLPMLVIATIYDNNKIDCLGQRVDQAGEAAVLFVDYQPDKNKMVWCLDREGATCLMSFRRLLP